MKEELLTVKEVAAMFAVTSYTVREWLKSDKVSLTGRKGRNGQWRVPRPEADRFAEELYGA
jgi:predicted site-specific integrase-resolvase